MKINKSDLDYILNKKIEELAKKTKKSPSFIINLLKDMSLKEIEQSLKKVSEMTPEPLGIKDVVEDRLKNRALERKSPKTGIPNLDKHIKGFVPGRVYVLTAETNVGKSALAANFAVNLASRNHKVLYISLEPGSLIADYIASIYYNKPYDEVTDEDLRDLDIPIKFYTEEISSIEMLKRVFTDIEGYDLVIIDHIGYFVTGSSNLVQKQADLMKEIASFAKNHKTAVMIIAHVNKQKSGKKKLTMDRISGSAAFKQDATDVLIINRDMDENMRYSNEGSLTIAKTKSGSTGKINLHFREGYAKIVGDNQDYEF